MEASGEFTDRADALAAFTDFLAPEADLQVLVYWGVAGQGKSTLIRKLINLTPRKYRRVVVDLEDLMKTYPPSGRIDGRDLPTDLLSRLADVLMPRSRWYALIAKRRYRKARAYAESLLMSGESNASIEAAGGSSVINSNVYVDSRFEVSAVARSAYRQRQVDALIDAISLTRRRRTLLFVDTSEWLWLLDGMAQEGVNSESPVGRWFTHEVLPRLLEAAPGLKIVFGGREPVSLPNRLECNYLELDEWKVKDTNSYLRSRGLAYQDLHDTVHSLCKGVPVWISLVADILVDLPETDAALDVSYLSAVAQGRPAEVWLPETLLTRVDPALKLPLICACVLDSVTVEATEAMVGNADLPIDWLRRLSRYSFIRSHRMTSGKAEQRVHDLVRTAMLEHLRRHEPTLLKRLHFSAAAYFNARGNRAYYVLHALAAGDDSAAATMENRILGTLNEGRLEDCLTVAELALSRLDRETASGPQRRVLAVANLAKGVVLSSQQRYELSVSHLLEAQQLYEHERDLVGQSAALRALSEIAGRRHEVERAAGLAEQALRLAGRSGDARAEAAASLQLGERLHLQQGSRSRAAGFLRHAVELYQQIGDTHGQANALMWLGEQARTAHRIEEAVKLLTEAFEAYSVSNDPLGSAIVMVQVGELHVQHGKVAEGRQHLSSALELLAGSEDLPSMHCRAHVYRVLAQSALIHREREAVSHLRKALKLYRKTGDKQGQAHILRLRGQLAMQEGDEGLANRYIMEARTLYKQASDLIGQAHASMFLGEIALQRGANLRGLALISEAHRIYREVGDPIGLGNTHHILGYEALRRGSLNDAESHLTQAQRMHSAAGDVLAVGHDRVSLAELALLQGNVLRARKQFALASEVYDQQHYTPTNGRYEQLARNLARAT